MWEVVKKFEKAICEYTGAPHAVAVESCTAALFLCCLRNRVETADHVAMPKITYPSVPACVVHAGGRVVFTEEDWQGRGYYELIASKAMRACFAKRHVAVDSAKFVAEDMFDEICRDFVCLSFHHKKALPIGRGGMILCEDAEDEEWFRWMKHDGRTEGAGLSTDTLHCVGWNMSFTPEQAARGLALLSNLPDRVVLPPEPYLDLSKYAFFTEANR